MKKRKNPTLVTLLNPPSAPAAWQRFHGKGPNDAEWTTIPDIPGVPRVAWVLGFFTGIETEDGTRIAFRWSHNDGPWLVGSPTDDTALWVVSRGADVARRLDTVAGVPIQAVTYLPSRTSGKYVPGSPYRHEFGEGGALPRSRWHEVYPTLKRIAPNAVKFSRPRGGFRIEPRGIVN